MRDPADAPVVTAVPAERPARTRRSALNAAGRVAATAVTATAACLMPATTTAAAGRHVEPAQLTYVHLWGPTDPHGRITEALVARFNEQHPDVQVQTTWMVGDYLLKLTTLIAAGQAPDIATCTFTGVAGLVRTQAVVPAETLYDGGARLDANDLLAAAVREMASFDGVLTVVPYFLNVTGLATNVSLYERSGLAFAGPPATWDALLVHARRITRDEPTRPELWGTVFPRGPGDLNSPVFAFIWQNGGELVDVDARKPLWTGPETVEAVQWQVDLVHRHRVAPFGRITDGERGDVGIWYVSSGTLAALRRRIGDAFVWGTAELPSGKRRATTVGGHALAVLQTEAGHERAWRFVHWYTTPGVNAEYAAATSTLPPWRATEQHALMQEYAAQEPGIQPFRRMLSYARPLPKLTRWPEIVTLLDRARVYAWDRSKTVRQALEDAAQEAEPLIQDG